MVEVRLSVCPSVCRSVSVMHRGWKSRQISRGIPLFWVLLHFYWKVFWQFAVISPFPLTSPVCIYGCLFVCFSILLDHWL
jgi:hypothetical protein